MSNPVAFLNGEYVPLHEAKVGIMTHALHYGTGAFEGIRGNWNSKDKKIYIYKLREHYERLLSGCKMLWIDLPYSVQDLCDITVEVVERSGFTEVLYIRPVAYKSEEKVANLNLKALADGFFWFSGQHIGAHKISRKYFHNGIRLSQNEITNHHK